LPGQTKKFHEEESRKVPTEGNWSGLTGDVLSLFLCESRLPLSSSGDVGKGRSTMEGKEVECVHG